MRIIIRHIYSCITFIAFIFHLLYQICKQLTGKPILVILLTKHNKDNAQYSRCFYFVPPPIFIFRLTPVPVNKSIFNGFENFRIILQTAPRCSINNRHVMNALQMVYALPHTWRWIYIIYIFPLLIILQCLLPFCAFRTIAALSTPFPSAIRQSGV